MFLTSELEILRTKNEMREYFEFVTNETVKSNDLKKQARLRKGFYKKMFEEFYPLYCYSQSQYCEEEARVAVVCGNQGFDAIKELSNGKQIKIEFTEFFDGKSEFEDAILLNERGMGKVHIGNPTEEINNYIKNFKNNAKNKSEKDYSEVILIFSVSISKALYVFSDVEDEFLLRLQNVLKSFNFKASEVLLFLYNKDNISNIDNNIYKIF